MKQFLPLVALLFLLSCQHEAEVTPIVRIGTLGDSITKGSPGKNYPEELDSLLPANYLIINYAVPGTCLIKNFVDPIWNYLQFSQLLTDTLDMIIIMLGTNDCNPTNAFTKLTDFEKDYREMISLFQGKNPRPEIMLCYPPPLHAGSFKMDSLIRTVVIPSIDKIAADLKLKIADTYHQVNDYPSNYPDGLHPNKGGAATLARIIRDALGL
jgi:acyl-CoA thioesterase I